MWIPVRIKNQRPRLPHNLQHGLVPERRVAEGGNVEESDFVGAFLKVAGRQLHRLAQVAHIARLFFPHVVSGFLGR
jgi:hypothetical protein